MSITYTVYQIIDPRDGMPFYVGLTSKELSERLRRHKSKDEMKDAPKKSQRILEIINVGLEPIIKPIKTNLNYFEAADEERKNIKIFCMCLYPMTNVLRGGIGWGGRVNCGEVSEETRRKISLKLKGKIPYNTGMKLPDYWRKSISDANKGDKAYWHGKRHSDETKEKIAEKLRGVNLPEETKKKISDKLKGRPVSEEKKKRISETLKGHVISEETRRKISETLKARNEEIRKAKIRQE